MIRRALLALWHLPWPPALRRGFEPVLMLEPIQMLLVAHFRCGVVGLIQNERDEYLLFRHTYRNKYPWGLPTGFMEHGEQPQDALRREICEESGFEVELKPVWAVYTDSRSILNVVFRGRSGGDRFTPSAEISEARFYQLAALPPMMPEQRHLLEASAREDSHQESA